MSPQDRRNRARWSQDQRAEAGRRFAASQPDPAQQRAEKLATLREMAEMMEAMPHMAGTLARVRADIARLEQ